MSGLRLPRRHACGILALGTSVLLGLAVSGCGALTPSLFAPSVLAPSVVPEGEASAAVVTARMPGRGLRGRVVDRETGEALAGAVVTATDADDADAAVTDAKGSFRLDGIDGASTLYINAPCYAPSDSRPGVGADSSASVLVLLAPVGCAATP